MAIVRPFKAVRPTPELAARVASHPYDVMNYEEACEMVKRINFNPSDVAFDKALKK